MRKKKERISEQIVKEYYEKKGFDVYRNGYPDFLIYDKENNCGKFVEVKGYQDKLRDNQIELHNILRNLGFEVNVLRVDENRNISNYFEYQDMTIDVPVDYPIPEALRKQLSDAGKKGWKKKVEKAKLKVVNK